MPPALQLSVFPAMHVTVLIYWLICMYLYHFFFIQFANLNQKGYCLILSNLSRAKGLKDENGNEVHKFKHPWFQTGLMFVGKSVIKAIYICS